MGIPINSPGSICVVERYQAPIIAAYNKIRDEMDSVIGDPECLKMATFAVNATVGPDGLCPMFLVFGALPTPARKIPAPSQVHRSITIDISMKETESEQARRLLSSGFQPNGNAHSKQRSLLKLLKQPIGSKSLVFRNNSKS